MTKQPVFKVRYGAIKNHKYHVMEKDLSVKPKLSQNVLIAGISGTVLCNWKVFNRNFTGNLTIVYLSRDLFFFWFPTEERWFIRSWREKSC